MKRRSAVKTLSLGIGYTMTASGMAVFMNSCKQDGTLKEVAAEWKPSFLSPSETTLLESILDVMLPTTEASPGYREVSAIQMFDNTLSKLWKKEDQADFKLGLDQVLSRVQTDGAGSIEELTISYIEPFLEKYMGKVSDEENDRRWGLIKADKAELSAGDMQDHYFHKFIHNIRNLGISTYFSNETIATEYLAYDPVPGGYNGCMQLEEGQRSWSL